MKVEKKDKKPAANPRDVIARAIVHLLQQEKERPTTDGEVLDKAFTIFEGLQTQIVELYNERVARAALYGPLETALVTQKPEAVLDVVLSDAGFAVINRLRSLREKAVLTNDVVAEGNGKSATTDVTTTTVTTPDSGNAADTSPATTGE